MGGIKQGLRRRSFIIDLILSFFIYQCRNLNLFDKVIEKILKKDKNK